LTSEWIECELGDVLTLKRGYDLPQRKRRPGSIPIVSSSGITGFHNETKVKAPGVVTGRYGTLGEVFYIDQDFWPLNTTLYVKDFKGNNPRFISYFLRTLGFESQSAAAAVPGVNRNVLHRLSVKVPSVPTQRKIAVILSAYDDLIENNTRRIAILEDMAQALYREWFVHFRFPGHEGIRMVESELGHVPEGWEVCRFSDVVRINPSINVDKEEEKPYVEMAGLSTNSMAIESKETRTGRSGSKFQDGDTLFPRITPSVENGKGGFVQFLPDGKVGLGSTEFIVLRSIELCPEYVYLLSRTYDFRENAIKSMIGASGRQRVQNECFDNYWLAKPPEQILNMFSEIVSPSFRIIQVLTDKNANLRRTRDLLLPRLISGELDVSGLEVDTEGLGA
jgi:type I restriction enzyme S subunit